MYRKDTTNNYFYSPFPAPFGTALYCKGSNFPDLTFPCLSDIYQGNKACSWNSSAPTDMCLLRTTSKMISLSSLSMIGTCLVHTESTSSRLTFQPQSETCPSHMRCSCLPKPFPALCCMFLPNKACNPLHQKPRGLFHTSQDCIACSLHWLSNRFQTDKCPQDRLCSFCHPLNQLQ